MKPLKPTKFYKMHGLGNDFVILDARNHALEVTSDMIKTIGHRHFGVGFDQLALLLNTKEADVEVIFYNSDGSQAGACGNASRCVARLLFEEHPQAETITLKTERGILNAIQSKGVYSINMGQPQFDWYDIPLASNVSIDALPIEGTPSAIGMGNPHCVFFIKDIEALNISEEGAKYEHHALFPERTNVEFIEVLDHKNLRMRVWERGGMITLACGSGACAAAVASYRRGFSERHVTLHLDGGVLDIDYREDGVWMTGAASKVFEGEFASEVFIS